MQDLTEVLIAWAAYYIAYSTLGSIVGNVASLVVLLGDIAIESSTEPILRTHFYSRILKALTIGIVCIYYGYTPTETQFKIILGCVGVYAFHEYMRSQETLDTVSATIIQGTLILTILTSILLGIF